jgi:chaperonin cofactor prefoldin
MPTTEQERLDWEVLKLQYECRPFYKNLDRIGSLVITVLAIAAFFYQRQQSNLEYQMAAIQAEKAEFATARAVAEKEAAEKTRDEYNSSIADLQAKLQGLQKTYQEMVALTDKVTATAARLPASAVTADLHKDLSALNTQQTTLDKQWTRQTEQVQMLKPIIKK